MLKSRVWFLALAGGLALLMTSWGGVVTAQQNTSTDPISIGWASRDVTPPKPVSLQGGGQRISKYVKDSLTVTALALAFGDRADGYAVFVSCDRLSIPPAILDRCREQVSKRLPGWDANKLILNATHSHTAPGVGGGRSQTSPPEVMTPASTEGTKRTLIGFSAVPTFVTTAGPSLSPFTG